MSQGEFIKLNSMLKWTNFQVQQLRDLFGHYLLLSVYTTFLSQQDFVVLCWVITNFSLSVFHWKLLESEFVAHFIKCSSLFCFLQTILVFDFLDWWTLLYFFVQHFVDHITCSGCQQTIFQSNNVCFLSYFLILHFHFHFNKDRFFLKVAVGTTTYFLCFHCPSENYLCQTCELEAFLFHHWDHSFFLLEDAIVNFEFK